MQFIHWVIVKSGQHTCMRLKNKKHGQSQFCNHAYSLVKKISILRTFDMWGLWHSAFIRVDQYYLFPWTSSIHIIHLFFNTSVLIIHEFFFILCKKRKAYTSGMHMQILSNIFTACPKSQNRFALKQPQ